MKSRLIALRDTLSASYWFIPTLMAVVAIALSIVTIKLDEGIGRDLRWVMGLVYVDSPEGARAVLSTVASSMITVAGVVFSLTMVVLSLTSQQFGPLVLSHFMRDRGNQFVLGVFTSTFIYCLLILRTIHGVEDSIFVPHISVLSGVGLSVSSLAVLIYFIHHISQSIQAPNIIARLSTDLLDKIHELFPEPIGRQMSEAVAISDAQAISQRLTQQGLLIDTDRSGYLQRIDDSTLLETAAKHNLIIHLEVLPGQFLLNGQALMRVLTTEGDNEEYEDDLREAFIIGNQRTPTQDVEFIITQLSALAVRSLSPGINDPFTAVMVIDHLADGLCEALRREPPSIYRYDEAKKLRVISTSLTFPFLFHSAFDQISHYGYGDPEVVLRLLYVSRILWECATDSGLRKLIEQFAARIYEESDQRLPSSERSRISAAYTAVLRDFETLGRNVVDEHG